MKKLHLLILAIFLGIFRNTNAQQCDFTPPSIPATGCTVNYLEYIDDPTTIFNEPILTVRVNIHVIYLKEFIF